MRATTITLSEAELAQLYRAVIHARDTAFLTTGSKTAPAVKSWQKLRDTIAEAQAKLAD